MPPQSKPFPPSGAAQLSGILAAPRFKLSVHTRPDGLIDSIHFLPPEHPVLAMQDKTATLFESAWHLYLAGRFDEIPELPLAHRGSPFQRRVWQAIADTPVGATQTYGQLAGNLGTVARAVGQACGANPFPIFIACHRIIGRNGAGGFAHARDGWLLDAKRWLLMHEGAL